MSGEPTSVAMTARESWSHARWINAALLGVCALILTAVGGILGALVGALTVVAWYRLGTPFAVATGTIGFVLVVPPGSAPTLGAGIALLVGLLVVGDGIHRGFPLHILGGAIVLPVLGVAAVWGGVVSGWAPLWQLAGLLLLALAIGMYLVHRLTLLRAGLVPDTPRT